MEWIITLWVAPFFITVAVMRWKGHSIAEGIAVGIFGIVGLVIALFLSSTQPRS